MYVATQAELKSFVEQALQSTILAIDTEFLREKTYYPKLCLLQIATEREAAIIDPFSNLDLSLIKPLLEDDHITKVFHAGHQDIEILLYNLDCIPHPIFDTQVAAALLGQTQQIGYAALVQAMLGIKLKKIDSYTDWSARPLSDSQLRYAADDVVFLPKLYEVMTEKLVSKGRLEWLRDEFIEMEKSETYLVDERLMYRRIKHVGHLTRRQMAAAREMAAWREIEARKRNLPRRWVLTDEQIVESCRREPRSIDDLFMVRGVRERLTTREARIVIELVRAALDSAPPTWPEIHGHKRSEPNVDVQVDMLASIVRMRARENGIAQQTLANSSDLTAIARGKRHDIDILKGWRYEIVGKDLIDFLEGRTVLGIIDNVPTISNSETLIVSPSNN